MVQIDCCEGVNYFCAQVILWSISHQISRSKLEICRSNLICKALQEALLFLPRAEVWKAKAEEAKKPPQEELEPSGRGTLAAGGAQMPRGWTFLERMSQEFQEFLGSGV